MRVDSSRRVRWLGVALVAAGLFCIAGPALAQAPTLFSGAIDKFTAQSDMFDRLGFSGAVDKFTAQSDHLGIKAAVRKFGE